VVRDQVVRCGGLFQLLMLNYFEHVRDGN
jgi:hypothetical protein